MSRRQAAEFLRGMVRRQKEHGNVRGQEYTVGGRECMEGSAKKLHAPGKREAAREWQDAMGETWMETNDGARRPQDVWEKAEQVASQIESRSAGGTPRRPPSRAEILAQLRTEQEAKEREAEEREAAQAKEPARAGVGREPTERQPERVEEGKSADREPVAAPEPAKPVESREPGQPSWATTQPVRLPSWVGAERVADELERQHTGREPLAIEGARTPTDTAWWERDREPVHVLPSWRQGQEASR